MIVASAINPQAAGAAKGPNGNARTPEEAAKQFESVLVRQFVEVMTRSLFQSDEEGMMTGQGDLRKDILTDTLTDRLVDSGSFGISDILMRQWSRKTVDAADLRSDAVAPADATGSAPHAGAPHSNQRVSLEQNALSPDAAPRRRPVVSTAPAVSQPDRSSYSIPSVPAELGAERPDHYRGSVNSLEHALRMFQRPQAAAPSIDNAPDTP